jgi:spermidine synthase
MGFVATGAQVLLLRRLMCVLYGNEMIIGATLAVWMVGTALGSLAAAPCAPSHARRALAAVTLACLVLLPATALGTYATRAILGVPLGQTLAPGTSIVTCLLLLVPLTALLGAMFVLFSMTERGEREERVGVVYLVEALGAAAGGVAAGLAASLGLPVFSWSFSAGAGLLGLLWLVAPRGTAWRVAGATALAATAALTWGPGKPMERAAMRLAWPGQSVIAAAESRYASLVVAESAGQRTLFVDALPAMSFPDKRDAEIEVHTALLQHPSPKRVLLVGGGLSQAAAEIFKYGVEALDYVQIDPAINRLERRYLSGHVEWPSERGRRLGGSRGGEEDAFEDRRVSVYNVDGRLFVSGAQGAGYDVVIVDLPDPATILMNRFYTAEFFSRVKAALAPGGVLAFTCGEMANYVSGPLGRLLACEATTLRSVFGYYKMLPLGGVHFVASDGPRWLTADGMELAGRLEERGIETTYMRDYYLGYDLSPERVGYLSEEVSRAAARNPKINSDRNPVGYFYYLAYWYKLLGSRLASHMETPSGRYGPYSVPAAAVAAFLATALPGLLGGRGAVRTAAVAAMGFATLTSQVAVLLAVQIFLGQLYYSLGLIVAAFMVGVSIGVLWIRRRSDGFLAMPQAILAWFCIALAASFFLPLERVPGAALVAMAAAAGLIGGFIGGALFQRAAYGFAAAGRWGPGTPAAALNAGDHLGAAAGALCAASILLPALGLSGTAAMAGAVAGGCALGLIVSKV